MAFTDSDCQDILLTKASYSTVYVVCYSLCMKTVNIFLKKNFWEEKKKKVTGRINIV